MEIYGWAHIVVYAYEHENEGTADAVALRQIQEWVDRTPPLQEWVMFRRGGVSMMAILNHAGQAEPFFEFYRYIAEVAPASYGLLYFCELDNMAHDSDYFYVLRMARGVIQKMDDPFLSPRVPLLENPDFSEDGN